MSIREWDCPQCGTRHDRDVNAGINLKQCFENELKECLDILNKKNTVGMTGIQACGDEATTLSSLIEQVLSVKQEASAFMQR